MYSLYATVSRRMPCTSSVICCWSNRTINLTIPDTNAVQSLYGAEARHVVNQPTFFYAVRVGSRFGIVSPKLVFTETPCDPGACQFEVRRNSTGVGGVSVEVNDPVDLHFSARQHSRCPRAASSLSSRPTTPFRSGSWGAPTTNLTAAMARLAATAPSNALREDAAMHQSKRDSSWQRCCAGRWTWRR